MGREAESGSDRDDFTDIYTEERDALHRWLRRHGGDDADADDLAAEVFARAYRGWDSYRGESSRRTWLWTIARNTLRNWRRSRARNGDVLTDDPPEPTQDDGDPPTEQEAAVRQLLDRIQPARARTAVYLRYVEGRSVEDVAAVMGTTRGAVTSLTHRALSALRDDLVREEDA